MSFGNPLLDVFTYLAAKALDLHIHLYSFVMGLFFGVLLYFLFLINNLFFDFDTPKGKLAVVLSMAIGMTGFATWFQIGSSTGEIPVSIFVLSGLYVLIRHWFVLKDISKKTSFSGRFFTGNGSRIKTDGRDVLHNLRNYRFTVF